MQFVEVSAAPGHGKIDHACSISKTPYFNVEKYTEQITGRIVFSDRFQTPFTSGTFKSSVASPSKKMR